MGTILKQIPHPISKRKLLEEKRHNNFHRVCVIAEYTIEPDNKNKIKNLELLAPTLEPLYMTGCTDKKVKKYDSLKCLDDKATEDLAMTLLDMDNQYRELYGVHISDIKYTVFDNEMPCIINLNEAKIMI